VLKLFVPLLPFRLLVVGNDCVNSSFALGALLLGPKELNGDSLAEGVEVLIEEEFFELLVDVGELVDQYSPEDGLVLPGLEVVLVVVEDLGELVLEGVVQLLGLQGDYLNRRADHFVLLGLVVPANQRHLLDHLEELLEHVDRVEQHLEALSLLYSGVLHFIVSVFGGTTLYDEPVVGLDEFAVEPFVLGNLVLQVLLNHLEPVLAVDED
jgi:hypothetical protein